MVSAAPEFTDRSAVVIGCSDLFGPVIDNRGRHARSSAAMSFLPSNTTAEIKAIVESRLDA